MTNHKYLSIDPGKGTRPSIGMAAWDNSFNLRMMDGYTKLQFDEYFDAMEDNKDFPEVMICEDYIIRPGRNHTGSRVETVQLIGAIKDFCRRHQIELVMQPSDILGVAQRWSGVKKYKGHLPDKVSAYLHGYYYLRKNKLIPSRLFSETNNG